MSDVESDYWTRDPRHVVYDLEYAWLRKRLQRLAERKPHAVAVDVGSGRGVTARIATDCGMTVTGYESSANMLETARTTAPLANFVHGDAIACIPERHANGAVDVISAMFVVMTMTKLQRANLWQAASYATRPWGKLLINMTNRFSLYRMYTKLRVDMRSPFKTHAATPSEIIKELEAHGFILDDVTHFGTITPVSLLNNFRGNLIPESLAQAVNQKLDPLHPFTHDWCASFTKAG